MNKRFAWLVPVGSQRVLGNGGVAGFGKVLSS